MSAITPDYILDKADAEEGPGCCDPEWISMSQIMRAAPGLLEALEFAKKFIGNNKPEDSHAMADRLVILDIIDGAIAKALGAQ